MFKRTLILTISVLLIASCGGDSSNNDKELFTVKSSQSICYTLMQRLCYLVDRDLSNGYENFYDHFENLEIEWGYNYQLSVKVTPIDNPPADGPSATYEVLEVISKTEDTVGTEYEYENIHIEDRTFSYEDGSYLFLGQPYNCPGRLDCDVLVEMRNSGGAVNLTFEYLGEGEIVLSYWN